MRASRGLPVDRGVLAAGLVLLGLPLACGERLDAPLPADLAELEPSVANAVRAAHGALAAAPDRAQAWGELGQVYEANEFLDLSLRCYRAASGLDPKDARWPYREAIVLSLRGESAEAIGAMERAADVDPGLARARWRLGHLHLDRGELEAAQAEFLRAIEIDPADASGWLGLSRARLQGDDQDGAIEAAREALTRQPWNRHARQLLGAALLRAGRAEEAREEIALGQGSFVAWHDPWDLEVQSLRAGSNARLREAQALVKTGDLQAAIDLLETLRRENPRDVAARNNLALAYRDAGRTATAREELESVLEIEPGSPGTRLNLAIVLAAQSRFEHSLEEVRRALALDPRSGSAREFEGVILRQLGRPDEAIEAFRSTLEVDQRNPKVRVWLGELLLERDRAAEAALVVEAALRDERLSTVDREALERFREVVRRAREPR